MAAALQAKLSDGPNVNANEMKGDEKEGAQGYCIRVHGVPGGPANAHTHMQRVRAHTLFVREPSVAWPTAVMR